MENKYIDYKMCGEITSVLVKGAQVACLPVSEQVHHCADTDSAPTQHWLIPEQMVTYGHLDL